MGSLNQNNNKQQKEVDDVEHAAEEKASDVNEYWKYCNEITLNIVGLQISLGLNIVGDIWDNKTPQQNL